MSKSAIDHLHAFLSDNEIEMDGISIQRNSTGLFIRAEIDLEEDHVVARIPKDAILSSKTTAIADLIESCELGGLLGLTLAVMYEKYLGLSSPWFNYLESLPVQEDIPLLWSQEECDMLRGTQLGDSILDDKLALLEDYESIIFPLLKENPLIFSPIEAFSFSEFKNVSSIVSSRAFHVDDYHLEAMVPLADVFNHASKENVHFECNPSVCEFCGESGVCECDILSQLGASSESGGGSVSIVSDPYSDAHVKTPLSGEDDDQSEGSDNDDIMVMRVVRDCEAGKEVFNTYGQHSNSYLLNRYGFCEENNPYDLVSIEQPEIIQQLENEGINSSARVQFWENKGRRICSKVQQRLNLFDEDLVGNELDEENEDESGDSLYIDWEGNPSFELQCFLRILLMSKNAFKRLATHDQKMTSYCDQLAVSTMKVYTAKGSADISESVDATTSPLTKGINQTIYILAQKKLSQYISTLEEDIKVLELCATSKERMALIMRLSEKKILHKCCIILERQIHSQFHSHSD